MMLIGVMMLLALATPDGSLSREDVQSALAEASPALTDCYTSQLRSAPPEFDGRVTLLFVVEGNGTIEQVEILEDTLGSPELAACVGRIIAGIVLPAPKGGRRVTIQHPFVFLAPQRPMGQTMTSLEGGVIGALIGTLTGAVVLGVGSFAVGSAISAVDCRGGCTDSAGTGLIVTAPYGAVLGGLLGGAVGAAVGVVAVDRPEAASLKLWP